MKQRYYNILTKLFALQAFILSGSLTIFGQAPVANFSGSPLSGCSPLIVAFQDLSTGGPTSWSWNFGNGNTSSLRNPTASYFSPGTYNVTLTVTNASGSNTLVRNSYVTVYEAPTVDFTSNITSGCFPMVVQFQDLSIPGAGNTNVSWLWDFGNGVTSTLQNPTATYTTAGSFSVTLRVTNDKGCTRVLSRPNYITVVNGVDAAFTHTQPTVCRPPADIYFTNNSTGPPNLTYLWDFGDGNTTNVANPMHTYTTSGSFIVTLVAYSSAGCQDTVRSNPIVIGGFTTDFDAPLEICANETASFTNTSSPAPTSSNWTFGDGGIAGTLNATHTYTTPGVYTVWLYNTYSTCYDSTSRTITVNANPVVNFTAPVRSRCEPPLTVNFQDLTPGAVSWEWDFGDGNTSTLQNPSHTYTSYGSFDVRLIVTNGSGCVDTLVQPAYVIIRRASVTIPGLPARGCIPFSFPFNPVITSVDAITSYSWDFGDGGTSTLPNPTYTYNTQGTYNVRLIITTSSGCTDDTTFGAAVRVGSMPVANFSAAPIPVCANEPVYFTDLSAPADEWEWDFGDGSVSLDQHPVHQYRDTGYFNIRLIAFNNGCPDTLIQNNLVYVLPPVALFDITPDCTNRLRFTFTDRSIAPLTWNWDFGDATTSTTPNPVHVFPALGPYNVRLVVTNGACADTLTQVVNAVDEQPDFFADITSGCRAINIPFHVTNINPALITTYFWDFGDGGTATGSTPDMNHTYVFSGTYTVTVTLTDINGCTSSRTMPNYIRVNGPVADFTATNPTGCSGSLNTVFNDLSTTDGVNPIVNWQFDFGDGTIQNFSAPPFQHTYNSVDTFTVKMIITDASGCVDSVTRTNLIITTNPFPDFTTSGVMSCPGSPITFNNISIPTSVSSFWEFGDGNTSIATSPTHNYAAPGVYTVKLRITDNNGCVDSIVKVNYMTVDVPRPDFTMSDSISSCTPFEVQFTNYSTYWGSCIWDFGPGEGTSMLTNPTHFYGTPGIYPVELKVTSVGGCQDSLTKMVRIYDTAGSRLDYLPQGGCAPLLANMTSFSPGPMVTYFWDFGDGYTQTTTTPTVSHVYNTFGDFLPKLIMEDASGCQVPLQGFDTIYVVGANARFGQTDSLFCDFGTVNFTDSTTFNDPVISYNWSFGDGGTSVLQHPVHVYNTPGLYTVELRIETAAGCRDTITKTNLVAVVQRPDIDIVGDTSLCIGSTALHSGIFIRPDTSLVTWSWSFPNGSSSSLQNPPSQVYNTAGTYTITAYAMNSTGCIDTTTHRLTVNPLPTVTMPTQITINGGTPATIPATYSPGTNNWLWMPSTGLSCTSCPTPDAVPKVNTTYRVQFTDANGCTNSGIIQVFVLCKNANLFMPNTFSPNGDGSNEVFYPRGKGLERVKLLRIFNRWGEVVFERRDVPVNDPSAGWNGTYRGHKPLADVYVYQAEVWCENGEIIKLNGNIALIL